MSRPPETSRVRRVLMQSIMWVILGATVGLAAFVDAHKTRRGVVKLGEPQTLQDVSLRLPNDWQPITNGERMGHDSALRVREDSDDLSTRVIDVTIDQPSLLDAFKLRQQPVMVFNGVPFGDQFVPLTVYNVAEEDPDAGATYFIQHFEMTRPLDRFRKLTLRLSHAGIDPAGRNNRAVMKEDTDLIKKVAESLQVAK